MTTRKYNRTILLDTLKPLLAKSGNQCAYPDCNHPIFNENGTLIAQLCHIEAVSPGGERYNPSLTDEEKNSYKNLLFLCYRHHIETNDVNLYSVEALRKIKSNHEAKYKEATYLFSDKEIKELSKEANRFWEEIDLLHSQHTYPNLAVPIDSNENIETLIIQIKENLKSLYEVSDVLMEEYQRKHFEYVCLMLPNLITRTSVALEQIEIKYLEELLLKKPDSETLKTKLVLLRKEFARTAQSSGLLD